MRTPTSLTCVLFVSLEVHLVHQCSVMFNGSRFQSVFNRTFLSDKQALEELDARRRRHATTPITPVWFDESVDKFPQLVAFGLDLTLWNFSVIDARPPLLKMKHCIIDSHGNLIKACKDIGAIFSFLKLNKCLLAIVSRTTRPYSAFQLLSMIDANKYLDYKEMFNGSKTIHFTRLHNRTSVPYKEMLFFDGEHKDNSEVSRMGVFCVKVTARGLSKRLVIEGLKQWQNHTVHFNTSFQFHSHDTNVTSTTQHHNRIFHSFIRKTYMDIKDSHKKLK